MSDRRSDASGCTDLLPLERPVTPQLKAYRKLTKNGNSVTVGVPGIFQRALSLFEGDSVELILDREWGGYFVRPYPPRDARPVAPVPPDRLGKVA